MSRKKSPSKPVSNGSRKQKKRSPTDEGFYTPFWGLDQQLQAMSGEKTGGPPPGAPPQPRFDRSEEASRAHTGGTCREIPDEQLFLDTVGDVTPLPAEDRARVPRRPARTFLPQCREREDWEVLMHLADLVAGGASFELVHTDEYIDGAVAGLSPAIVKGLKKGRFSYQAYIDLHGCTREEALELVTRFIRDSHARGLRCVLVVSGKGLNSKNREPVLKNQLVRWFLCAPLKRFVLAFASARSCDGGSGAFYVLLRRRQSRHPVVSPAM